MPCVIFKVPANGTFYNGGIEKNLEAMRRHYPAGFVMRLYHDFEFDEEKEDGRGRLDVLCRISCGNADLDLCDARDIGGGLTVQGCTKRIFTGSVNIRCKMAFSYLQ